MTKQTRHTISMTVPEFAGPRANSARYPSCVLRLRGRRSRFRDGTECMRQDQCTQLIVRLRPTLKYAGGHASRSDALNVPDACMEDTRRARSQSGGHGLPTVPQANVSLFISLSSCHGPILVLSLFVVLVTWLPVYLIRGNLGQEVPSRSKKNLRHNEWSQRGARLDEWMIEMLRVGLQ
eukprot:GHVU01067472.1.p1 GENE.GHVU01067472.1~~GHVU01067472.1.p1  ORF type:complete len:179 (+),score=5.00 GHVU01067472.1:386-922(+)